MNDYSAKKEIIKIDDEEYEIREFSVGYILEIEDDEEKKRDKLLLLEKNTNIPKNKFPYLGFKKVNKIINRIIELSKDEDESTEEDAKKK